MDHSFHNIISLENLCQAWQEFIRGKKDKKDVTLFSLNLSRNIYELHKNLKDKTYIHGPYAAFSINDPKPRSIHKATVRDRLLHHAIYKVLYPYFDRKFIFDSYSCRDFKGTHRAIRRFKDFGGVVSEGNSRTCWVLKCDIQKFFANIDHEILFNIIKRHIVDENTLWLIEQVVNSFCSFEKGKGLPLGNLTSQLLVNIYMNEFDQYMKHVLKQKYYIRYADDFIIMHYDRNVLIELLPKIKYFLSEKLKLPLHSDKVFIKTLALGVDFLGWVHFPHHRVLRTTTKRRMFKNIKDKNSKTETVQSYIGLLKHGNTRKLITTIAAM